MCLFYFIIDGTDRNPLQFLTSGYDRPTSGKKQMPRSKYCLYLMGITSLSLMSSTNIRIVRNALRVFAVSDKNIVMQIYTTAIGHGTTISRPAPSPKPTMSALSFIELWSASKLIL